MGDTRRTRLPQGIATLGMLGEPCFPRGVNSRQLTKVLGEFLLRLRHCRVRVVLGPCNGFAVQCPMSTILPSLLRSFWSAERCSFTGSRCSAFASSRLSLASTDLRPSRAATTCRTWKYRSFDIVVVVVVVVFCLIL